MKSVPKRKRAATETNKTSERNRHVGSVVRALIILELLGKRGGLGVSAVSHYTGYAKSSTSYLLRTLVKHGYVNKEDGGKHTLGIRVLSLAGQANQGIALRRLALPFLGEIVNATKLGAHLAVLNSGEAVYLERIESSSFIKMDIWPGKRVAPQTTAIGKALMCHMNEDDVRGILTLQSGTVDDLQSLMEDLAKTKARRYATDDEQHARGVRCVAAPVLLDGKVVASIGVSGSKGELPDIPKIGAGISEVAVRLSRKLEIDGSKV